MLDVQREFEREVDYFGIQYLYKAGYDPDCFLGAVQRLWQPDPKKPQLAGLSPSPPLAERMKALQKEKDDILPSRLGATVSTPAFDQFMEQLRRIMPPEPSSENNAHPKLIR